MHAHVSAENGDRIPGEGGVPPRVRRFGERVLVATTLIILMGFGAASLWQRRGFASGQVTIAGQALPFAQVRLQSFKATKINPPGVVVDKTYDATADEKGNYRLSFLPPGRYVASVTRTGDERPFQSFTPIATPLVVEIRPGFQTFDIALENRRYSTDASSTR